MNKEKRIQNFEECMQLCIEDKELNRTVAASIADQRIIWQEDAEPEWEPHYNSAAKIAVSIKRSFKAAEPYARNGKKVCVLNFASSVTPGGGVTYGSQAQEESLCRVSSLYAALSSDTAKDFYARHHELIHTGTMTRENRDDCIYTPGVVILREDDGEESLLHKDDRFSADVITCAAPDLRNSYDNSRYAPTEDELFDLLKRRWRRILAIAASNGAQVLILGAFGCGVFANPPRLVAEACKQVIADFDHCFEVIEFAIYSHDESSSNYMAFAELFQPRNCSFVPQSIFIRLKEKLRKAILKQ